MVEYQTHKSFSAQGNYKLKNRSFPVQLSGRYKPNSGEPIEIIIKSTNEPIEDLLWNSMDIAYGISFEGMDDRGMPLKLLEIKATGRSEGNQLTAEANIYIEGDFDETINPGDHIKIIATTSPTPLIKPEWSYFSSCDGTISRFGEFRERVGIRWEIDHGTAQLIDNYEFSTHKIFSTDVLYRMQLNSLILNVDITDEQDICTFLTQLPKMLSDDLSLLSFIGRERLVIFETTCTMRKDGIYKKIYARYKAWTGFFSRPVDQSVLRPIIRLQELKTGVFEHLVNIHKKSPDKEIIARVLPYLLTSYEDGYYEPHLMNAFSALEGIVNNIGIRHNLTYLLKNNQFKRFSKKVNDLIDQEDMGDEIASGIKNKVPDLRRRAFIECLLFLLEKYEIKTQLLWPPGIDERKEFHNIVKRRNTLVHQGIIGRKGTIEFDLSRIQRLVELWILKLLDCPDEAINTYGLWHEVPINKVLHY